MKLKFKNQAFQMDAVNAVVDLFAGQEKTRSTFSVMEEAQTNFLNELGQGNALYIDQETLTANMHTVQKRNNLPLTPTAEGCQFCIEMETGTGKTYVYTKTIFELNRKYGFTKFVIVVPSVAIREGVYKSFQVTQEHFGLQYDNVPCRYFIYNSAKLSDVRQFATSSNIEVMIINIDAFKKAENIINQAQDRLNGETAMGFIQNTHPIVIIDEPQSVDNTPKAKEAIATLNPLCVLRYSATHREKINLLYRLTPVDAYQMGLVKQIAVSSNQVAGGFNQAYVRLLSVSNDKGFKARVELDVKGKTGAVTRKAMTVKPGDGNCTKATPLPELTALPILNISSLAIPRRSSWARPLETWTRTSSRRRKSGAPSKPTLTKSCGIWTRGSRYCPCSSSPRGRHTRHLRHYV